MRFPKIQLLTATGCRPNAWRLCERWMMAQTWSGEVVWLIVDDGPQQQPITFARDGWKLGVIRPTPFWRAGQNTQARNLLAGLAHASRELPLAIIEDDDYYSPLWLERMFNLLAEADDGDGLPMLLGESRACYYNVRSRRGRRLTNENHASLCSTVMTGAAIPHLQAACLRRPKYIDLDLWADAYVRKALVSGDAPLSVGIKGQAGRAGIGMGHRPDFRAPTDRTGAILRGWIGDDANAYLGGCHA